MNQKKNLFAAAAVLLAVFCSIGLSEGAQPLGKRLVLKNGITLLLSEKHEIPMITINVTIQAGDISAPADKPGLASVTASLLTEGTARRSSRQISSEIDFIGGSLSTGGGADFASASLRVLKKDIRTGLDLLSDVLLHPAFDEKEINRKVKAMLAEIQRQKEEPGVVAGEAFEKEVYGNYPYGRTNDEIAAYLPKMTRQDIVEFYRSHYGANNVVMAVVGDFKEKEILSLLDEYFKTWKHVAPSPVPALQFPEIAKVTVKKIDKKITQANIDLGHIGIKRENPDFYAVSVMNYILGGGGFSSRLMDNIRDNKGLAYDVHSGFAAMKETGIFTVSIQTKNESANEVIEETLREIARMQTELVSEKELNDAKAYLTGSFPLRMDTSAKIASMLTSVENYHLGLDYPDRYPGLINAVSREDIRRVARTYLHPDKTVIVVVADQGKAKLKY